MCNNMIIDPLHPYGHAHMGMEFYMELISGALHLPNGGIGGGLASWSPCYLPNLQGRSNMALSWMVLKMSHIGENLHAR